MVRCSITATMAAAAFMALLGRADATATDRVLVVGELFHAATTSSSTSSSGSFTPEGLAELAMDAFGLPTASLSTSSAAASPLQADLFTNADALAMVLVDDAALVDAVASVSASAALTTKGFPLTRAPSSPSMEAIPAVIARELQQQPTTKTKDVRCIGATSFCRASGLQEGVVMASKDAMAQVLQAHAFLDESDTALVELLAQTQQLTAQLQSQAASTGATTTFYAVEFVSALQAMEDGKKAGARTAVVEQVQQLLVAMQRAYTASGAQIVAATPSLSSSVTKEVNDVVAYARMLVSMADEEDPDEAEAVADDQKEDAAEEEEELASSASGSLDMDNATNGTTTSDVDIDDIAEYQIVLWTSVLLGATLVLVIMAMCNMEPKRDSLLYAKFTTGAATRKMD